MGTQGTTSPSLLGAEEYSRFASEPPAYRITIATHCSLAATGNPAASSTDRGPLATRSVNIAEQILAEHACPA